MREEGEGEAEQGGNVVGAAAAAPELPSITRRTGTGTAYGWREGWSGVLAAEATTVLNKVFGTKMSRKNRNEIRQFSRRKDYPDTRIASCSVSCIESTTCNKVKDSCAE